VRGRELYFVTKVKRQLYILDLDDLTYRRVSTRSGSFTGRPDQIETVVASGNDLMLLTEDGTGANGIHARQSNRYYTISEATSDYANDETSGLALSPDKKHLYFVYQDSGILFDVTRDDGRPFDAETLPPTYRRRRRG
jgi:hypothetical protein